MRKFTGLFCSWVLLCSLVGCSAADLAEEGQVGVQSEALTLLSGVKPTSITLDGKNAYFTNAWAPNNVIDKVPLAGGPKTQLASVTGYMTSVVVQSGTLYWANINPSGTTGGVWSVPVSGSVAAVQLSHHADDLVSPQALLVYQTSTGLFVTNHVLFGDVLAAKLYDRSSSVLGVSEISLLPDLDPVSHLNYYPFSLVRDSSSVYFLHDSGDGLFKAPLSGGAATQLVVGAETKPLAIDSGSLYFRRGNDIKRVANTGGIITTFVSSPGVVTAMVTNAGYLYWACGSCGTLVKKPLSGGTSITLATGLSNPSAIAVDATYVYFGTSNTLGRVLK